MLGAIHLAEMDYHTLAIYMWEAGSVDPCFAWKFSKMRLLGMSANHTKEKKVLELPEAWWVAVYKTDKRHKAWQLTQPLCTEVEGEGQGGLGPSILWLASFNVTPYASNRASPWGKYCTGHSHRTVTWESGDGGRGSLWQDHQWQSDVCQSPRGSTEQKGQYTSCGNSSTEYKTFTCRLASSQSWELHGRKTPSSLGRETKRRGIHRKKIRSST